MKKGMLTLVVMMLVLVLAACGSSSSSAPSKAGEEPPSTAKPKTQDDATVIIVAHTSADTASHHRAAMKFKEKMEAQSEGRFEVQVYPNGQMGSNEEMIETMRAGKITLVGTSCAFLGNFVEEAIVFDTPFLYRDDRVAKQIFADKSLIEALNRYFTPKNMYIAGIEFMGFRTLTCNKEVHSPADLKGMKVRTMENPYHLAIWKSLGANPTPLAYNELYTGLQQGTVEGQENPIELTYTQKFYEQQKFIVKTEHIPFPLMWVANNDFIESLSEEDKKLFFECLETGIQAGIDYNDQMINKYITEMGDYGTTMIDLSEDEYAQFQNATKDVLPMFEKAAGAELFNKYMEIIDKHR